MFDIAAQIHGKFNIFSNIEKKSFADKITWVGAGGGGGSARSVRVSGGGAGSDPCGAARPVLRGGGDRPGGVRRQVGHRHSLDPAVQRVPGIGKKQGFRPRVFPDLDPVGSVCCFGPLGSASHKYGPVCGLNIKRYEKYIFLHPKSFWIFWYGSGSGSWSGSVSQRNGSEEKQGWQ